MWPVLTLFLIALVPCEFSTTSAARVLLDDDDNSLGLDTSKKLDIYLLADNTGSMGGEIRNVRENATSIFKEISAKASDVFFGVGAYRDEQDDFVFKKLLELSELPPENTPREDNFIINAISEWSASGGGDSPEAQLFALYKIATDDSIGWRPDAERIVAWFGDAPGHDPTVEGVTERQATEALQKARIRVLAIDVAHMNQDGQAERIALATNGRFILAERRPTRRRPPSGPRFPIIPGCPTCAVATTSSDSSTFVAAGAPGRAAATADDEGESVSGAIVEGVSSLLDG